VNPNHIERFAIWGNHSSTMVRFAGVLLLLLLLCDAGVLLLLLLCDDLL
jgi:hypothetical protein